MAIMTIMDIYNFMSTYLNSSLEHMYIWLKQFNISDQLIFIKLFSTDKIKLISKYHLSLSQYPNKHFDNKCKCRKTLDALDNDFKKHVRLEHFFKCVNDSTDYMHPPTVVLDLEKVYTFDKKQEDDLILKYNPISVIRSNSLHKGNNANELVNEEKYLIRCTNKYLLKNKNNFSLPISIVFNRLDNLHLLLSYMNVVELYTLYRIKYAFNLNDVERLLPEYWRFFNRSSYENKTLSPYTLLNSIYKYHNIQDIIQCDTNTKATFRLSNIIDEKYYNKQYFSKEKIIVTQPNFCGYRVVICKTIDSGILITNKHGLKVNVPCQAYIKHDLMFETKAWYTGEFIIMPYDPIRDLWMHHNSFYQNSDKHCKLVLVDLFVWNGINLLGNSYGTRLELIKHFILNIKHNNLIVSIPTIKSISTVKNAYKNELRDSIDGKTHFNGVVFRHFNVNYQKEIYRKIFCVTKCEIFTKYKISTLLVSPKKPGILCRKHQRLEILIKNNNYIYSINVVCYKHTKRKNNKITSNILNLAIFDKFRYVSWQKIQLDGSIKITYTNHKIKIINKQYNWTVINVGFNEFEQANKMLPIIKDIVMLEVRPDKSLTDCASLTDLKNY